MLEAKNPLHVEGKIVLAHDGPRAILDCGDAQLAGIVLNWIRRRGYDLVLYNATLRSPQALGDQNALIGQLRDDWNSGRYCMCGHLILPHHDTSCYGCDQCRCREYCATV